jgi:uncharacterized DUF497 family protein
VRYEWDEAKNLRNQRAPGGVTFELAALVFEDEDCLVAPDHIDRVTGEQRWHAIGAVRNEPGTVAVLLMVRLIRRNTMAKKLSASSQPARLKSMKSEDIKSRRLTNPESQTLQGIAARQAAGDDSRINFKGFSRLTDRQLAAMVRFRDVRPRKRAVSVRLDEHVLVWLKSKGRGHLTLINDILANLMEAELKTGRNH